MEEEPASFPDEIESFSGAAAAAALAVAVEGGLDDGRAEGRTSDLPTEHERARAPPSRRRLESEVSLSRPLSFLAAQGLYNRSVPVARSPGCVRRWQRGGLATRRSTIETTRTPHSLSLIFLANLPSLYNPSNSPRPTFIPLCSMNKTDTCTFVTYSA